MLGRLFDKWSLGKQQKEMEDFVLGLRGADGEELAGVTAVALELAESYRETEGWDLFEPQMLDHLEPTATFQMSSKIGKLQATGQQHIAAGLMVWVHTMRAMQRPQLRMLGREMWSDA